MPSVLPRSHLPRASVRTVLRGVLRGVLGVSLTGKLVGVNALVAAAAVAAAAGTLGAAGGTGAALAPRVVLYLLAALGAALALSLGLVALALRPLHALEDTAARVWRGDLEARVPESPLADPAVARVGRAFNAMLDGLARDRARHRELTAEVIRAGDAERGRLGCELHDSAAQTLAAAVYQLSAARHALGVAPAAPPLPPPPAMPHALPHAPPHAPDLAAVDGALALAHRLAADALEEVRTLARGIRPSGPGTPHGAADPEPRA